MSSNTPLKPSLFSKWFKEQFGRVPNEARIIRLRERAITLRGALEDTEALLHAEIALADSFKTALYVWNAWSRGKS